MKINEFFKFFYYNGSSRIVDYFSIIDRGGLVPMEGLELAKLKYITKDSIKIPYIEVINDGRFYLNKYSMKSCGKSYKNFFLKFLFEKKNDYNYYYKILIKNPVDSSNFSCYSIDGAIYDENWEPLIKIYCNFSFATKYLKIVQNKEESYSIIWRELCNKFNQSNYSDLTIAVNNILFTPKYKLLFRKLFNY